MVFLLGYVIVALHHREMVACLAARGVRYLLERTEVNEADRKRLMVHSLKGDITNGVYGHRGVGELKLEIGQIEWVRVVNISLSSY